MRKEFSRAQAAREIGLSGAPRIHAFLGPQQATPDPAHRAKMAAWAVEHAPPLASTAAKRADFAVNLEWLAALHLTGVPVARAKDFTKVVGLGELSENCDAKVRPYLCPCPYPCPYPCPSLSLTPTVLR